MLDTDKFYIFKPPYSKSEYFVQTTSVETNGNEQYVHYTHILNDMNGDCERQHFENNSIQLTEKKIRNIIKNLGVEIENLTTKRQNFERLLEKINDTSTSESLSNGETDTKDSKTDQ